MKLPRRANLLQHLDEFQPLVDRPGVAETDCSFTKSSVRVNS